MARVHPGNPSSRLFDYGADQPRNYDTDERQSYASVTRGGGRAGGGRRTSGGRGGGRVEHNRCFRCGLIGHYVRDCPMPDTRNFAYRGNQASVNDSSYVNVEELTSELVPLLTNKQKELESHVEEIKTLNSQLKEANEELDSFKAKNEEMILNMTKLEEELKKCKEELSIQSIKNEQMHVNLTYLINEYIETKDGLIEKIDVLEEEKMTADAENMMLKQENIQLKKAAKAIVSVFVGNAEICSKTPELESIVLYYSNRAVKRMSHGKIRKAIDDCKLATRLDPGFLKACLTAGNCHLVLGEIDDALRNYKKCLDSGMVCLDRRLTIEAYDGLQNAEKVVSYINQSAELLQNKTRESATDALEIILKALSITSYSEKLLEMKGEALFLLDKYEDVVEMCEKTLVAAEKNYDHMLNEDQIRPLKLWRWSLVSRAYFCLAKFDLALEILEKYEQLAPDETKTKGPLHISAAIISELLRCKNAGNEAFKSGKYREAVDHYSKAIIRSIESRSFTAICLCNRAAAHQALGEITDAIADCNLAIALDGNYIKAISRRANLHEKIRDYEHAALDFERLISLLEKGNKKKLLEDLTVARRRLSCVNRNLKQGSTLNLYLILGLKGSESGPEIKKAYHKAALRHHPDKAGKFLARSESGADGIIFKIIQKDADMLFKMIGEAYAVLSDPNKRFKYNLEDAMGDEFGW